MSKTAFIFPGQGAQKIGMAQDFYENIPECREIFEKASRASGLDIPALCFEENEELNITEYTQIAMLAAEAAILKAVRMEGIESQANAGLSLGEYGALIASCVLSEEDAFQVIRKRGIYMQEAVPEGGAMAAVMGMGASEIEEICNKTEGIVSIANYNCPGQIVITGEQRAVLAACDNLKAAGAKRTIPLNVSGPFHSALLKGAGEKLGKVLENVTVQEIGVPYITNVTADYVTDKNQVKDLLKLQVSSSVRWQQSIERLIADGTDTFIEIGPGKTLSGFMRKIDRNVSTYNIETMEDLEKVKTVLKGEAKC